jgi:Cu2+-exporting ATPase
MISALPLGGAETQSAALRDSHACSHCGNPVPPGRGDGFCCTGCLAVNRLLAEAGLQRYYDLKPGPTAPQLGYFDRRPSLAWLDAQAGSGRLSLGVEGIQCGACVWVIGQLAARQGPAKVEVNSALGRLGLRYDPALFDVKAYLQTLAQFGYRVRPFDAAGGDPSRPLLLRLGVCAAVTLNTMSFSLPFYLGLADDQGGLAQVLRWLSLALTSAGVAYGGGYFFRRAWASLRHGVAHFDITISLGLAAAFAGSLWSMAQGRGDARYLDSVNLFLTLMLLGRFLQERALLGQRRQLLQADSFALATVTALDLLPHEMPWTAVETGQRLLLQPGTLCPSDALLEEKEAEFDLASVNGEAHPALLSPGLAVPAGARLLSARPAIVRATAPFSAGLLARLLPAEAKEEDLPVLWRWTVRYSVGFVLLAAFGGLAYWLRVDPPKALPVFIAVLVVTCPCALGIAVPLARTLADRRLAAQGLTLRRPGLLERLHGVRQVWLDKTGTLTLADLELVDPGQLDRLGLGNRLALMGAASASRHPVSRALFRELSARGAAFPMEPGAAEEIPGLGVRYRDKQGQWFLGRSQDDSAWAQLTLNGRPVASFQLRERVLQDAPDAVRRLQRLGLKVGLLSGDAAPRVAAMAVHLGLRPEEAHAQCNPETKAARVAAGPSLMLGDGLNDSQALRLAAASGTPSWESSPQADQSDFSFSSGSLAWLPELFETARALRRALWGNLAFALVYNLSLTALALTGGFSPLLCAVTMPGSSLLVILLTARAMRRR